MVHSSHHIIFIPIGAIFVLIMLICRLCFWYRRRKRETLVVVRQSPVRVEVQVPQPLAQPAYLVAPPAYSVAPPMQPGAPPAYQPAPPMQPGAPTSYPEAPPMQPGAPPAYQPAPPMQPGAPPAYPQAPPMNSTGLAQPSVQPEAPPYCADPTPNSGGKSLMGRVLPSRLQGQQNQFGYKPLQE